MNRRTDRGFHDHEGFATRWSSKVFAIMGATLPGSLLSGASVALGLLTLAWPLAWAPPWAYAVAVAAAINLT